jgi:hypothetical protein
MEMEMGLEGREERWLILIHGSVREIKIEICNVIEMESEISTIPFVPGRRES